MILNPSARHRHTGLHGPISYQAHFVWATGWMLAVLLLLNGSVFGQQPIRKVNPNGQTELLDQYANQRKQTLQLANKHGWPLLKNYSKYRQLRLQGVDTTGQPIYYLLHNAEAALGTRTTSLSNGTLPVILSGGSDFMNGRLGLWDGGLVLATHRELGAGRIRQRDITNGTSDHATHLAGTLLAKGIDAKAKGMAFGAQLSVWDYTNDLAELTTAAPDLLVSNHAYGPVAGWVFNVSRPGTDPNLKWEWWGNTAISQTEDYLFGFYSAQARDLDRLAYNNPFFLMVRSADNKRAETGPPAGTPYYLRDTNSKSTAVRQRNDGYDVIPGEATAKNVLTIGAADPTFDAAYQQLRALESTGFSGWGPTDDGRIKPDLLGMGTAIYSTLSTSNADYGTYSGTSMASANVSGSLFLLQELYAQQRGGNATGRPAFMRAATLRGLALHTANRPNPATGPTYRTGWGLLNAEAAARVLLNENLAHEVLEQALTSRQTVSRRIVAQGSEPLVVTLCWTDPEASATPVTASSLDSRTPKLTNDLDLRLTDNRGTLLPFVLNPAQPDQPAKPGDNTLDNVEQVFIENPIPGQAYTLTVSYKGMLTYNNQPFSLIISGLRRATNCTLTASISPSRDTTICTGETLILQSTVQKSGYQYQWLRNSVALAGANTATLALAQSGSYALRLTDQAGCSVTAKAVNVTARNPIVSLSPAGDQWLCPGKPMTLTATTSGAANAVVWLRDGQVLPEARTTTLTVTQPGTYQIRDDQTGCQWVSEPTVVRPSTVNAIDLTPAETELVLPLGATVTLVAPLDASYLYQWFRDNVVVTNASAYRLSVAQTGIYKVEIRQQTCVGFSTERIIESATPSDSTSALRLYPVPSDVVLSIRYQSNTTKPVQVSVYDSRGVVVIYPFLLRRTSGHHEAELPTNSLPPGPYILRLTDGSGEQTGRFIKK